MGTICKVIMYVLVLGVVVCVVVVAQSLAANIATLDQATQHTTVPTAGLQYMAQWFVH